MLDVALVTRAMWRHVLTPALRRRIAAGLGVDDATAEHWIVFWAGLHDVGKASPGFQCKDPRAKERLKPAGLGWWMPPIDRGHGLVSALAMAELLPDEYGVPVEVAEVVATAVGGHHGVLPSDDAVMRADVLDVRGDKVWAQARAALTRELAGAVELGTPPAPTSMSHATAMAIAGLVSVADWIGSDERYFPPASGSALAEGFALADYARHAADRAVRALNDLGWLGWKPAPGELAFGDLFPSITEPRPVQVEVGRVPGLTDGPGMLILELPMGEGKTEAAFYAADRWGAALGQRGTYVAMPTMATSNQMFGRAHEFLSRRYPESVVNLQLLHSHAALAVDLEAEAPEEQPKLEPSEVYGESGADGALANVVAAGWFTKRKRGLLAPFGVGTVDQGLLAALQTRHVFVRLFGLAGKTVIFDEVHAYDVYMNTLFEQLLAWLGALGSSVVVLSATLPDARRRALLAAYASGAGRALDERLLDAAYPRLSWLTATEARAVPVAVAETTRRTLQLRWLDGGAPLDDLAAQLGAALARGGCAAVICNTVARAQQVYQALKPHFPGCADDGLPVLDLFHARYPFEERQRRELRALGRFGKPGGTVMLPDGSEEPVRRPEWAVLVATQVIEQSLDLDFDLMVSDLAPVDLLLQRSGRLHRHADRQRPAGLEQPTLWIRGPEAVDNDIPDFGHSNELIYHRHVLLRSWLTLRERERVGVPDDVAELIEAVYEAREAEETLPAALRAHWETTKEDALDEEGHDRHQAEIRLLKAPTYSGPLYELSSDPRDDDAPELHQAHQAMTRLAEPNVGIVCLYGTPERPTLDPTRQTPVLVGATPPSMALAKRLLGRSVNLTDRRVVRPMQNVDPPTGWRRSALLRHHRPVVFDAQGLARVAGREGRKDYWLHLDDELGLRVLETEEMA
jgi:CRISPR-associated endonuclease/helicase Cas3